MDNTTAIAEFDQWQRIVGLAPTTRKRRRTSLQSFTRWNDCNPKAVNAIARRRGIEQWLGSYDDAQTRRSYLGDVRAFFTWAQDHGHIDHNPTDGMRSPKIRERRPNPLTRAEIVRSLTACRTNQDRLAIELGRLAGLRVSEMAHLDIDDVDLSQRVLHVRQGKGGKDRAVPISNGLAGVLASCGTTMQSNLGGTVSDRIKAVFARARVTGHRPHDLRATFATELIRADVDLVTVRDYLGHSSVATTQRYILPDDAGVELVNRLDFAI